MDRMEELDKRINLIVVLVVGCTHDHSPGRANKLCEPLAIRGTEPDSVESHSDTAITSD